jgi:hypothetical protein
MNELKIIYRLLEPGEGTLMLRRLGICFVIVAIFSGCYHYRYGETWYSSAEDALKAAREETDRNLSLITSTTNPTNGRALVIIPSNNLIEKKGVRRTDNVAQTAVDYLVSIAEIGFIFRAEAVRKRQIFNAVEIERSENPEAAAIGEYDAIIFFTLKAVDQGQWFLKMKSKDPMPIYADTSLPRGVPRTTSWLNNIEKLVREQLSE